MTTRIFSLIVSAFCLSLIAALAACATTAPPESATALLLREQHILWETTNFGGEGEVRFHQNAVELDFGNSLTGITWRGSFPECDYEIEFEATRIDGDDFFCCLTFPVSKAHISLVLGGWGGTTSGLSCIDGRDASENETTQYLAIDKGQSYPVRLRVEGQQITVWFDDELLLDFDCHGHRLNVRPEVELSRPLGIASFSTLARIENLRWRKL